MTEFQALRHSQYLSSVSFLPIGRTSLFPEGNCWMFTSCQWYHLCGGNMQASTGLRVVRLDGREVWWSRSKTTDEAYHISHLELVSWDVLRPCWLRITAHSEEQEVGGSWSRTTPSFSHLGLYIFHFYPAIGFRWADIDFLGLQTPILSCCLQALQATEWGFQSFKNPHTFRTALRELLPLLEM